MSIRVLERLKRVLTRSNPASVHGRIQREALSELFGAAIDRQLADRFHINSTPASLPDGLNQDPRLSGLSALGFPSLFVASVYLDDSAGRELEGSTLVAMPTGCCICRRPAVGERTISGNWLKPDGGRRTVHASVPVCDRHSVDTALPMIALAERIPRTYLLTAVGNSAAFLTDWAKFIGSGDFTPPWRIFADQPPEWGGWRQGNGEYWLHNVWLPFWSDLPQAERQRYLAAWDAPREWREAAMDW